MATQYHGLCYALLNSGELKNKMRNICLFLNCGNVFRKQVTREYTAKVDKLEASDAQRVQEGEQSESTAMMIQEPQLMITAGPMGISPQYAQGGYAAPGYAPQMPYQGYGM